MEVQRAESGDGVLGDGAVSPSPPSRGLGELPQRGLGRSLP